MLESKPRLPSSFWKPATKNGQIYSWRGLFLEMTTSQYFMHFVTFQTSYLVPIYRKQYFLALVLFPFSLWKLQLRPFIFLARDIFQSEGHLRVIQLVGSFWYLRRLWSSPGHKAAQFYPPTCNSSIFREEIRNSLSISAILKHRDSQYAGEVIALFSLTYV